MNARNPYDISKGDQRAQHSERSSSQWGYAGPNGEALTEDEVTAASILGAKVYTAAKRGNRAVAYELVEQQLKALQPIHHSPFLALSVAEVGIDLRSCNMLEQDHNIITVEQLLAADRGKLLDTPNFGPNGMIGIFAQLVGFMLGRMLEMEDRDRG